MKVADKLAVAAALLYLIIEHHLRSFRRSRNREHVRGTHATGPLRRLRDARQVR